MKQIKDNTYASVYIVHIRYKCHVRYVAFKQDTQFVKSCIAKGIETSTDYRWYYSAKALPNYICTFLEQFVSDKHYLKVEVLDVWYTCKEQQDIKDFIQREGCCETIEELIDQVDRALASIKHEERKDNVKSWLQVIALIVIMISLAVGFFVGIAKWSEYHERKTEEYFRNEAPTAYFEVVDKVGAVGQSASGIGIGTGGVGVGFGHTHDCHKVYVRDRRYYNVQCIDNQDLYYRVNVGDIIVVKKAKGTQDGVFRYYEDRIVSIRRK